MLIQIFFICFFVFLNYYSGIEKISLKKSRNQSFLSRCKNNIIFTKFSRDIFLISLLYCSLFYFWLFGYNFVVFLGLLFIQYFFFFSLGCLFIYTKKYRDNYKFIFYLFPLLVGFLVITFIYTFNLFNSSGFLFEFSVLFSSLDSITIFSSYFVSFVIACIFVIFSDLFILGFNKDWKEVRKLSFTFFIFSLILFFPYLNFSPIESNYSLDSDVLLVQGNFDQDWVWRHDNSDLIFSTYENLSLVGKNYDLIVWPEYVMAFDIFKENDYDLRLKELSHKLNTTLVVGHTRDVNADHYDSASVFSKGDYVGTYDSIEPVVFNEQTLLGEDIFIFEVDSVKYGIIICYEELNKEIFIRYLNSGVDVIVSLTNEQHITSSFGLEILSKFVNLRAKEFSIPILRSTNTGITMVVSNSGETLDYLGNGVSGVLDYS